MFLFVLLWTMIREDGILVLKFLIKGMKKKFSNIRFFLLFFFSFFRFNLSVTINTTREISERNTEIANFVKFFVQAGLSYFHFERRFTCLEIASTNEIWKLVKLRYIRRVSEVWKDPGRPSSRSCGIQGNYVDFPELWSV